MVVVSFGQLRGAELWLEETGCVFDMYTDPEREVGAVVQIPKIYVSSLSFMHLQVYTAIGLGRSIRKTWGISAMCYYAKAMASGKNIPSPHSDIEDDPLQVLNRLSLS